MVFVFVFSGKSFFLGVLAEDLDHPGSFYLKVFFMCCQISLNGPFMHFFE